MHVNENDQMLMEYLEKWKLEMNLRYRFTENINVTVWIIIIKIE